MSEAIYDAFYKGFDKCKRKMVQAFSLLDLKDIVVNEPEEAKGRTDSLVQDDPAEIAEPPRGQPNPSRVPGHQSRSEAEPAELSAGDRPASDGQDKGDD